MRKGKIAAQVAHAAMKFLLDNNQSQSREKIVVELTEDEAAWCNDLFTKVVVSCDSEDELEQLVLRAELNNVEVYKIIDAGKTEFNGIPTLTCAAFGPCEANELDKITGHLKLL